MKRIVLDFLRRGLIASGIGPVVLAIVYLILRQTSAVHTLTVDEVCVGIFSMTGVAFIAGAMNALYQIERLPLMAAIMLHGAALYISYLGAYLLNDWLNWGLVPVGIFTGIFVVGYIVIWALIYSATKRKTARLNESLKKRRQSRHES